MTSRDRSPVDAEPDRIVLYVGDVCRWTWATWIVFCAVMAPSAIILLGPASDVLPWLAEILPMSGRTHLWLRSLSKVIFLGVVVALIIAWLLSPVAWLLSKAFERIAAPGWHVAIYAVLGGLLGLVVFGSLTSVLGVEADASQLRTLGWVFAVITGLSTTVGWIWAYRKSGQDIDVTWLGGWFDSWTPGSWFWWR